MDGGRYLYSPYKFIFVDLDKYLIFVVLPTNN